MQSQIGLAILFDLIWQKIIACLACVPCSSLFMFASSANIFDVDMRCAPSATSSCAPCSGTFARQVLFAVAERLPQSSALPKANSSSSHYPEWSLRFLVSKPFPIPQVLKFIILSMQCYTFVHRNALMPTRNARSVGVVKEVC